MDAHAKLERASRGCSATKIERERRTFTPEFKRQAAALFEASGRSVSAVAVEIDVHETVLRHWIDQLGLDAKRPSPGNTAVVAGPSLADQAAESAQLRGGNERLRMERDILKKAALILGDQKRCSFN